MRTLLAAALIAFTVVTFVPGVHAESPLPAAIAIAQDADTIGPSAQDWFDWCGDVWEPAVAAEDARQADFDSNMMFGDNIEMELGRHLTDEENALVTELGLAR